jgi:putative two-component system response regulator
MARILIVDDEAGLRQTLGAFLTNDGHAVQSAADVSEALGVLETSEIDVVVSDIIMPGESGVQLLAQIQERNAGIAVILLTGEPNVDTAAEAVRLGAFDYLSKPISKSAILSTVARATRVKEQRDLNVRLAEENKHYRENLEALVETRTVDLETRTIQLDVALRGTIGVLAQTLGARDPYTAGHQSRVAGLCRALATELGLPESVGAGLEMAALVHDLGKIAVPAEILSKPTRLKKTEFALIKEHSTEGYEILRHVAFPWPIADIILQHHERPDGLGYPAGLVGDAIRLEALVIGVADTVEAMASHRPYRAALGIDVALEEIARGKGRLYDARVVDACLRLFRERGYHLDA